MSYTLTRVIIQPILRRWRKESEACSTVYATGTVSAAVKKRLGYKKSTTSVKSSQHIQ